MLSGLAQRQVRIWTRLRWVWGTAGGFRGLKQDFGNIEIASLWFQSLNHVSRTHFGFEHSICASYLASPGWYVTTSFCLWRHRHCDGIILDLYRFPVYRLCEAKTRRCAMHGCTFLRLVLFAAWQSLWQKSTVHRRFVHAWTFLRFILLVTASLVGGDLSFFSCAGKFYRCAVQRYTHLRLMVFFEDTIAYGKGILQVL